MITQMSPDCPMSPGDRIVLGESQGGRHATSTCDQYQGAIRAPKTKKQGEGRQDSFSNLVREEICEDCV